MSALGGPLEGGNAERDGLGDAGEARGTSEDSVRDADGPDADDFFSKEESAGVDGVEGTRFVGDEGPAVASFSTSLSGWCAPSCAGRRRVSSSTTALRTTLQIMPGRITVLNLCMVTSLTPTPNTEHTERRNSY